MDSSGSPFRLVFQVGMAKKSQKMVAKIKKATAAAKAKREAEQQRIEVRAKRDER